VNEAITNANESMADGIQKSDGWGKSLLKANGQLDTTTKNGQSLFSTFNTIADGASNAAIAGYDFAQSQGKSLPESLAAARGEMTKSRDAVVDLAQKYGLTKTQAQGVADSMGLIPGQVSILLEAKGVDSTLAELLAVQAEFEQWPDKQTIKVDALSEDAKKKLEDLGYQIELIPGTREYKITAKTKEARGQLDGLISEMSKVNGKDLKFTADAKQAKGQLKEVKEKVRTLKGRSFTMKALTGTAERTLKGLGFKVTHMKGGKVSVTVPPGPPKSQVGAIQGAINSIHGRSVTVTVHHKTVMETVVTGPKTTADLLRQQAEALGKADGGTVDFYAGGGVRKAGGAENHVAQIAPGGSWRVWGEPETQGEGYVPFAPSKRPRSRAITEEIVRRLGGDPHSVAWNADGNITDWRYDPQSGSLYSASDAGSAGHKTKKVKTKVKGKWQTKEVEYFDIGAVEKKLKSASKATIVWNKNLEKVADRVGGDVANALAAMGEDGMKLAAKMAKGSTKYINEMAKALRDLQKTAKASLTDYTRQLGSANKLNKAFSDNLAILAGRGYGDLAQQLAAQNDEAAQQLAAAAVKDNKKAGAANNAAKTANNALTGDEVGQLISIIAAIKTSKTGIHAVAGTTGLGEDEIIKVAAKATRQIRASLGGRSDRFLSDLVKAQAGRAYADGGIRAGLYATRGGAVTFAEPSTGGEAYIPLGSAKRRSALPVLADVANRFGVGLTDAQAARPVVIVHGGGDTHVTVTPVRTGASASDIGAQVGRSVRRARRGGVAARAA
jgi:hypothetical protein